MADCRFCAWARIVRNSFVRSCIDVETIFSVIEFQGARRVVTGRSTSVLVLLGVVAGRSCMKLDSGCGKDVFECPLNARHPPLNGQRSGRERDKICTKSEEIFRIQQVYVKEIGLVWSVAIPGNTKASKL